MKEVVIRIKKSDVYDEVEKTTSYVGSKMHGDETAYKRIMATESSREMLERYWSEAASGLTEQLKPFIIDVSDNNVTESIDLAEEYYAKLNASNAFNNNMTASITASSFSYLVNSITSNWLAMTNSQSSEGYVAAAAAALSDVAKKIYHKGKPTRIDP